MSIDITHTIRPQKVQFLNDKDTDDGLNNQAFTGKTVERPPQSSAQVWFCYHNKDI